jgi:hypothetical protein
LQFRHRFYPSEKKVTHVFLIAKLLFASRTCFLYSHSSRYRPIFNFSSTRLLEQRKKTEAKRLVALAMSAVAALLEEAVSAKPSASSLAASSTAAAAAAREELAASADEEEQGDEEEDEDEIQLTPSAPAMQASKQPTKTKRAPPYKFCYAVDMDMRQGVLKWLHANLEPCVSPAGSPPPPYAYKWKFATNRAVNVDEIKLNWIAAYKDLAALHEQAKKHVAAFEQVPRVSDVGMKDKRPFDNRYLSKFAGLKEKNRKRSAAHIIGCQLVLLLEHTRETEELRARMAEEAKASKTGDEEKAQLMSEWPFSKYKGDDLQPLRKRLETQRTNAVIHKFCKHHYPTVRTHKTVAGVVRFKSELNEAQTQTLNKLKQEDFELHVDAHFHEDVFMFPRTVEMLLLALRLVMESTEDRELLVNPANKRKLWLEDLSFEENQTTSDAIRDICMKFAPRVWAQQDIKTVVLPLVERVAKIHNASQHEQRYVFIHRTEPFQSDGSLYPRSDDPVSREDGAKRKLFRDFTDVVSLHNVFRMTTFDRNKQISDFKHDCNVHIRDFLRAFHTGLGILDQEEAQVAIGRQAAATAAAMQSSNTKPSHAAKSSNKKSTSTTQNPAKSLSEAAWSILDDADRAIETITESELEQPSEEITPKGASITKTSTAKATQLVDVLGVAEVALAKLVDGDLVDNALAGLISAPDAALVIRVTLRWSRNGLTPSYVFEKRTFSAKYKTPEFEALSEKDKAETVALSCAAMRFMRRAFLPATKGTLRDTTWEGKMARVLVSMYTFNGAEFLHKPSFSARSRHFREFGKSWEIVLATVKNSNADTDEDELNEEEKMFGSSDENSEWLIHYDRDLAPAGALAMAIAWDRFKRMVVAFFRTAQFGCLAHTQYQVARFTQIMASFVLFRDKPNAPVPETITVPAYQRASQEVVRTLAQARAIQDSDTSSSASDQGGEAVAMDIEDEEIAAPVPSMQTSSDPAAIEEQEEETKPQRRRRLSQSVALPPQRKAQTNRRSLSKIDPSPTVRPITRQMRVGC